MKRTIVIGLTAWWILCMSQHAAATDRSRLERSLQDHAIARLVQDVYTQAKRGLSDGNRARAALAGLLKPEATASSAAYARRKARRLGDRALHEQAEGALTNPMTRKLLDVLAHEVYPRAERLRRGLGVRGDKELRRAATGMPPVEKVGLHESLWATMESYFHYPQQGEIEEHLRTLIDEELIATRTPVSGSALLSPRYMRLNDFVVTDKGYVELAEALARSSDAASAHTSAADVETDLLAELRAHFAEAGASEHLARAALGGIVEMIESARQSSYELRQHAYRQERRDDRESNALHADARMFKVLDILAHEVQPVVSRLDAPTSRIRGERETFLGRIPRLLWLRRIAGWATRKSYDQQLALLKRSTPLGDRTVWEVLDADDHFDGAEKDRVGADLLDLNLAGFIEREHQGTDIEDHPATSVRVTERGLRELAWVLEDKGVGQATATGDGRHAELEHNLKGARRVEASDSDTERRPSRSPDRQ